MGGYPAGLGIRCGVLPVRLDPDALGTPAVGPPPGIWTFFEQPGRKRVSRHRADPESVPGAPGDNRCGRSTGAAGDIGSATGTMQTEWKGDYLDGQTAIRRAAAVRLLRSGLEITTETGHTAWWPYGEVRQTQGFYEGQEVRLERGGQLPEVVLIRDAAFLSALHRAAPEAAGRFHDPSRRRRRMRAHGSRGARRRRDHDGALSLGNPRDGVRRCAARSAVMGGAPGKERERAPGARGEALHRDDPRAGDSGDRRRPSLDRAGFPLHVQGHGREQPIGECPGGPWGLRRRLPWVAGADPDCRGVGGRPRARVPAHPLPAHDTRTAPTRLDRVAACRHHRRYDRADGVRTGERPDSRRASL